MTSAPELLPCPFCGGVAIPALNDHGRMWVIRCRGCNVEFWEKNDGHYHQDFIPMINFAWNRRADLHEAALRAARVEGYEIARQQAANAHHATQVAAVIERIDE